MPACPLPAAACSYTGVSGACQHLPGTAADAPPGSIRTTTSPGYATALASPTDMMRVVSTISPIITYVRCPGRWPGRCAGR